MNEQEKIRELESTIEDLTRHLQIEEQIARMGDRTPYRELESDLASERVKRVEAEALAERWKSVDAVTVTELLAAEATIEQVREWSDHLWDYKWLRESLEAILADAGKSALARHDAEVWEAGRIAGGRHYNAIVAASNASEPAPERPVNPHV